ncbi:MAG: phage tail protein [Alphaproteobacteria bacterium]|jgi:hypothetical protein|nr:phage tail protein [Alphaproteobacteria bacterium]
MTQNYYTLLTKSGLAKETNAHVNGENIRLTHLAIGDSSGSEYDPTGDETELKNELLKVPVNRVYIDETNDNYLVVEAIIPVESGPFFIREIGVFDSEGDLFAIGKYPPTYKPVLSDGSSKGIHIRMILSFVNIENVNLVVDPNITVCTEERANNLIDAKITPLENRINEDFALKNLSNLTNEANASTTKKGVVELATLTEARDENNNQTAITPKTLNTVISEKVKNELPYGYIKGGVPSLGSSTILNLTKCEVRSRDNTQNIVVAANNVDLTNNNNWANGSSLINGNILPAITSNSTADGYIVSSVPASSNAYRCFDGNTGSRLEMSNQNNNYITIKMPSARVADSYLITCPNVTTSIAPKNWTFQGSNDGSNWDVLDTVTNQTSWGGGETRSFSFKNVKAYSYYRIHITGNNGGTGLWIAEITIKQSSFFVFADYNNGNPKYVIDDYAGSNIVGAKRKIAPIFTNSSNQLIPFKAREKAGGGIIYITGDIILKAGLSSSYKKYKIPTPINVYPHYVVYTPIVNGNQDNTITYARVDGVEHYITGANGTNSAFRDQGYATFNDFYNSDGTIELKSNHGEVDVLVRGFTDERIIL